MNIPYIYHKNQLNVGKYTSPMDALGNVTPWLSRAREQGRGYLSLERSGTGLFSISQASFGHGRQL